MKTSEMATEMKEMLNGLVRLFLDRNVQYAGEEDWSANFKRNAELGRILRFEKIIAKPYGKSIMFAVEKIDRAINGIILTNTGTVEEMTHIGDSIDDAVVYLFITKMLLKEEGILE
jgi:hypothetical protein